MDPPSQGISVAALQGKLRSALQATDVVVIDTSADHCGSSFDVAVVSPLFEGKATLARHRMVNEAIKDEMASIHALSIKRVWTPAQQQQLTSSEPAPA